MKFVLFVEGHAERDALPKFLKRWFDQRLGSRVGIQAVRFEGWADFKKRVGRKVQMHLRGPKNTDIIAAIGLLDLYGPTFYPPSANTVSDRLALGAELIEKEVNDPRFRMFFAVHELEAWILSQPELLPPAVRGALPAKVGQPEVINFNEPPSKLLNRLYNEKLKTDYKKVVNGKNLFAKLDPAVVYEKCPNFAAMLQAMLELAQRAQA